nr:uncharacterized protein C11orf53 homolog [Vicugna pacos]
MASFSSGSHGKNIEVDFQSLEEENSAFLLPHHCSSQEILALIPAGSDLFVPGDYSKRVYQGVRVKHTVKDLLAEKRSRQTSNSRFNGSVSSSQSPFVPMPGSPVMSGYYGVRRSFLSDSDFHSTKQFASDACSPGVAKPFACEPAAGQGHAPPQRDSWEQTVPEGLSQPDPVPADALQSLAPSTSCLSQLELGSTAQHRSSSWGAPLAGVQPYSLHALEDLYHTQGYPTPAPYPFTSFMTMSNDPPPKVGPFSPDEGADTSALQDPSPWTKEDGSLTWGAYECRRAY